MWVPCTSCLGWEFWGGFVLFAERREDESAQDSTERRFVVKPIFMFKILSPTVLSGS